MIGAPVSRRASSSILATLALLALAACRADDPRPCPASFAHDGARAGAILSRLRRSEAASLVASRPPPMCFGEPPVTAVTTEGVLLLDRRDAVDEAAARVGHLLSHVAEGLGEPRPGDAGCDAVVDAALAAEARAISLELRLRRELGVSRPRVSFAFEGSFWETPPDGREAMVLGYLRAHPDGAPGLDALAAGYRRRCEAR